MQLKRFLIHWMKMPQKNQYHQIQNGMLTLQLQLEISQIIKLKALQIDINT